MVEKQQWSHAVSICVKVITCLQTSWVKLFQGRVSKLQEKGKSFTYLWNLVPDRVMLHLSVGLTWGGKCLSCFSSPGCVMSATCVAITVAGQGAIVFLFSDNDNGDSSITRCSLQKAPLCLTLYEVFNMQGVHKVRVPCELLFFHKKMNFEKCHGEWVI